MIKFTKGQQVWELGNWNSKGVFFYRLVTVQSWGEHTGTLTRADNGQFLKSRVYTDCVNKTDNLRSYGGVHYFPADEGFDPVAKALELSALFIQQQLAAELARRGNNAYHQPSVEKCIEFFSTVQPSVHAY